MGGWVLTVDSNTYWRCFLIHFLPHWTFTVPFQAASCHTYRVPVRNTSDVPLEPFIRHLYIIACLLHQTSTCKISKVSYDDSNCWQLLIG